MTYCIPTPASCDPRPTVAVLGAGIAGLTAAHELAERGFGVTVYEYRADERNGLGTAPPGAFPPVKLGGLAASQYSTVGTRDGSPAELRPFPDGAAPPHRRGAQWPVSTDSASFRPTTCTSGICSNGSPSTGVRTTLPARQGGVRHHAP